ncbi:hypothetical protein TNCV_1631411 [Trichonephila clavipes]|nr:hypothetical protein TNCV_1631411 [Trichonephila clavipes]
MWNVLPNKSSRVPSSLTRSAGVACFRLLTGHDYLQKPLHRIGVKDSTCYPLCPPRRKWMVAASGTDPLFKSFLKTSLRGR